MTPVLIPCSRSAHDQNVPAQGSQWDQQGCHSKRGKASELGGIIWMDDGCSIRSTRQPRPLPQKRGTENWKALVRANGTSREIDCEAIGGSGG